MGGSALLYILLLTVIPVALAPLIALPFVADSSRPIRSGKQQQRDGARERVAASALSSGPRERKPSDRADRAA